MTPRVLIAMERHRIFSRLAELCEEFEDQEAVYKALGAARCSPLERSLWLAYQEEAERAGALLSRLEEAYAALDAQQHKGTDHDGQ